MDTINNSQPVSKTGLLNNANNGFLRFTSASQDNETPVEDDKNELLQLRITENPMSAASPALAAAVRYAPTDRPGPGTTRRSRYRTCLHCLLAAVAFLVCTSLGYVLHSARSGHCEVPAVENVCLTNECVKTG